MKNNGITDVSNEIEYKGVNYKLVFNLNVMQEIQAEYKTLEEWGKLTDGENSEPDIKAVIYGFKAMINEGIDISNEDNGTDIKPLTSKQVGRMITEIGLEEMASQLNQTVVESTKGEGKNA